MVCSVHELQIGHTADLGAETLRAARVMLEEVFGDQMDAHSWDHALGGMHALVWEGSELVGHASVVQRRLLHGGRSLRTGYVEILGVRGDRQGRGYGAMLMDEIECIIRGGYEMGALAATDAGAGFYAARGWKLWTGQKWVLTPGGPVPTEDDDVYVLELPAVELDTTGDLTCDWREGEVW